MGEYTVPRCRACGLAQCERLAFERYTISGPRVRTKVDTRAPARLNADRPLDSKNEMVHTATRRSTLASAGGDNDTQPVGGTDASIPASALARRRGARAGLFARRRRT